MSKNHLLLEFPLTSWLNLPIHCTFTTRPFDTIYGSTGKITKMMMRLQNTRIQLWREKGLFETSSSQKTSRMYFQVTCISLFEHYWNCNFLMQSSLCYLILYNLFKCSHCTIKTKYMNFCWITVINVIATWLHIQVFYDLEFCIHSIFGESVLH